MKFLRVQRLDQTDLYALDQAAEVGEWAVPGSFAYIGCDPHALEGKTKIAFASTWLGTESFARATFVEVAEISEADFAAVAERLARHFVERYGAPSLAEALPTARDEAEDARTIAEEHKINTLLSIEREPSDPGADGLPAFTERIRVIHPERAGEHAKIWTIVEGGGEETGESD